MPSTSEQSSIPGRPVRSGACLGALIVDHAAPSPTDVDAALVAAAEAGAQGLSVFAAHAAAAVGVGTPRDPNGTTAQFVGQLVANHRRAPGLLREGALEPFAARLDELGLGVSVLEFVTAWTGDDDAAIDEETTGLCEVATRFGAPRILALCVVPAIDPGVAARGLARAADIAAEHGIRLCIEFTALFAVGRLEDAVELIDRAGRPNVGITLDTFHWARQPGGPDLATLRRLDPERVDFVQVAGAPPGSGEDLAANWARAMPDEDPGLDRLLAAIDPAARPFVAGEVFDHARLHELGARAFARRMTDSVDLAARRAGLLDGA